MEINEGIKLRFERADKSANSALEIYDSLNRIPFSLKINYQGTRPTSVYCEVSHSENFIELWFDKGTKKLYEITAVSIQEDSVEFSEIDMFYNDDFFYCLIDEMKESHISMPIKILRSSRSLTFIWSNENLHHYPISSNCILGVGNNDFLCSISIVNLSEEQIFEILGF